MEKFTCLNFLLWIIEHKNRPDVSVVLASNDNYSDNNLSSINKLYDEYYKKYPKGLTGFTDDRVTSTLNIYSKKS